MRPAEAALVRILEGIRRTVVQLESGRHELEDAYPRAVRAEGNVPAKRAAARAAGVRLITGDTKVVDRGSGDGLYVNTAGSA